MKSYQENAEVRELREEIAVLRAEIAAINAEREEAAYTAAVTPEERTRQTFEKVKEKVMVDGEEKEVERTIAKDEKYMFAYFDGWGRD